jgi:hypothetical protein
MLGLVAAEALSTLIETGITIRRIDKGIDIDLILNDLISIANS